MFSVLSVNGSRGAGLHPQQLRDWSAAALVKVQARDPLDVSDSRLVEPHVILHPLRLVFCALSKITNKFKRKVSLSQMRLRLFCFLVFRFHLANRLKKKSSGEMIKFGPGIDGLQMTCVIFTSWTNVRILNSLPRFQLDVLRVFLRWWGRFLWKESDAFPTTDFNSGSVSS